MTELAARPSVSVVILTFNRPTHLQICLQHLSMLQNSQLEVIVVNNGKPEPAAHIASRFSDVKFIQSPDNLGAAGRNLGFQAANAGVVITLDDDVFGLTLASVEKISRRFARRPGLGALCFRVVDAETGNTVNWVHHRPLERYVDKRILTYEITEGAVAIRKSSVPDGKLYPTEYFISHEGPDLAFRLLKAGYCIEYDGSIAVKHAFAPEGRMSWRNFYYDTRNSFWLAARHLPATTGSLMVIRQCVLMFLLSIRDRHFLWWLRGLRDGITGFPAAWRLRIPLDPESRRYMKAIDRKRASAYYMLRKHLLARGFKL